jgi:hypothetical protein
MKPILGQEHEATVKVGGKTTQRYP